MTDLSDRPKTDIPEQSTTTSKMANPDLPSGSPSNQPDVTGQSVEASDSNAHTLAAATDTTTPSPPETVPAPAQQEDSLVISQETTAPSPPAKHDDSGTAIEAATNEDATKAIPAASKDEGPVCVITLLVTSGKKHPYKIDEKYLTKRNVHIPGTTESGHKDPFSISVYTLKELILREWREEWEPKPSSPTLIRLIHFGKLLADKDQLNRKYILTSALHIASAVSLGN